jgi:Fe2+ transport system protein FeoA
MTLQTLRSGDSAVIASIQGDADVAHRLESLGFVEGKTVTVLRSRTGTRHVRIGTTEWVMRDSTAELIRLEDHV